MLTCVPAEPCPLCVLFPLPLQICHSSKQWSGLLYKVFGLRLDNYFDTQQANYVLKVCQTCAPAPIVAVSRPFLCFEHQAVGQSPVTWVSLHYVSSCFVG